MKAVQRYFLPLGVSCHKGIGQRQTGIIVNELLNSCNGSFIGRSNKRKVTDPLHEWATK